ncbi:MAG: L,D-transpeptidase [Prolixibacteraceae bacterium]|nr:L,D-transpeptidase [Prolixibacteraceae bacterium]
MMVLGKKKKIKWLIIILLSVVFVAITVSVIIVSQKELPTEDLRIAREALSEAKEAEANLYAEKLYKQSVQMYDSAMVNWSRENNRFILFRDYTRIIAFAKKSKKVADEAKDESIKKADNLSKNVEAAFVSLAKKIELYNKLFKNLPLSKSVFDAHNKSKMFLSESKIAHETGKLKDAEILFKKADIYINHANTAASKMLRDYFNDYPRWKRLANDAIAASKGGNKVILVDKVAHILYVYQSGKAIRSFDVEFGPNWMAHKERSGDKATPEGNYRITSKKERGSTTYYKAMLLDYPNAEDRAQFAIKKRKGLISRGAGIGNLIEIHGNGGRGFDWTSGCVGMRDRDIDDLYRLVSSGTRVTIVGSIEPLATVTGGVDF